MSRHQILVKLILLLLKDELPGYAYVPTPQEVGYPDIPYAAGYGYDPTYATSKK